MRVLAISCNYEFDMSVSIPTRPSKRVKQSQTYHLLHCFPDVRNLVEPVEEIQRV